MGYYFSKRERYCSPNTTLNNGGYIRNAGLIGLRTIISAICTCFLMAVYTRATATDIKDSIRIKGVVQAAIDSMNSNPIYAEAKAKEALEQSKKANFIYGEIYSFLILGSIKTKLDEKDKAISYLETALEICRKNKVWKQEAQILLNLANAVSSAGDHKKALQIEQLALQRAEANKDTFDIAGTYSAIGRTLTQIRYYESALQYHMKAIEYYKIAKNPSGVASGWQDASSVLLEQEKYKEALPYIISAIRTFESMETDMTAPYINLGLCYDQMGKKDSAMHYYFKALQDSRLSGDKENEQRICNNIATLYEEQKRIPEAIKYYKAALAAASGHLNMIKGINMNLANLYAIKGDYKNAYNSQLKATYASDSFLSLEKVKALAELNTKFETQQLAYSNSLLEKKVNEQKYIIVRNLFWIYCSLSVLFIIILLGLLYYRQNRFKMRLQRMELEQQQYHAQMNPHFIFNCLNSIQHYFINNDVISASRYLSQFALLMRKTMDNNKHQTCTVSEEIEYLNNYLLLEQMRFENKFSYNIICSNEVDQYEMRLFPMIIQPFIENAIVHGLCYLKSNGTLSVIFTKEKEDLICRIDDNGIGREASVAIKKGERKSHESRGIKLVENRLSLVSKLTKRRYHLSIIDKHESDGKASGTLVIIRFPQ